MLIRTLTCLWQFLRQITMRIIRTRRDRDQPNTKGYHTDYRAQLRIILHSG